MNQLPTTSHPLAIAFDEASGPRIGLCPLLPQAIIAAHGPFVLDRRTCVSGDRDASLDTLVCHSRTGLAIAFHFSVWTDCPFAKINIEITNDSDRCVTWQGDGLYTIAVDNLPDAQVVVLTGGVSERQDLWPASSLQLRTLSAIGEKPGRNRVLNSGASGQSSHEICPWLMLHNGARTFVAALAYSGGWQIPIEPGEAAGTWRLRIGLTEADYVLPPGRSLAVPAIYYGTVDATPESTAQQWCRFVDERVMAPVPCQFRECWPPITYSTWGHFQIALNETELLAELNVAADLGIEGFILDAGWYRNCPPGPGAMFSRGLGNWQADPDKFPSGLPAFADAVHRQGLKIGIWFEPERAHKDEDIVRNHPQWLATRDGQPVIPFEPDTYLLDFSRPDVQDWAFEKIRRQIEDSQLDWIKWDMNYLIGPYLDAPDHGPEARDGLPAHVNGVYQVLDQLAARFPNVAVDGCSSGGNRLDFGFLARCTCAYLNDYTRRARTVRAYHNGAAWMLPARRRHLFLHRHPESDWRSAIRSRFDGVIGVADRLAGLSDTEQRVLREELEIYKRQVRPLLGSRRLYESTDGGRLERWRYIDEDANRETAIVFENEAGLSGRTLTSRIDQHSNGAPT